MGGTESEFGVKESGTGSDQSDGWQVWLYKCMFWARLWLNPTLYEIH